MTNQVQYRAPKWAIELRAVYKKFEGGGYEASCSAVLHAGRIAIESEFECSEEDSMGFFWSELEPIESHTFGIVEPEKPEWTHVVHNSDKAE